MNKEQITNFKNVINRNIPINNLKFNKVYFLEKKFNNIIIIIIKKFNNKSK